MTSSNLAGKNVVIIGGTAGIGLAAAKAASELGGEPRALYLCRSGCVRADSSA